jgi:hypothetical protein
MAFKPSVLGEETSTLTVNDTYPGSPQTITVNGIGSALQLAQSLSWQGNTQIGKTFSENLTVKNVSTSSVSFSNITTIGDYTQTNTCQPSLAAGKSCTVTVTFAPTGSWSGFEYGNLVLTDSDPSSPQTVWLKATATQVAISPNQLSFPTTKVGTTSAPLQTQIINDGTAALTIGTITTTGDFAISQNHCGTSLAAGAKCVLGVTFTPTQTGARTGNITITDSDQLSPQVPKLTGTGD